MASVAKNQEDVTIPETPTVVTSPNDCGDVLDSDEDISEDEDDGVAGEVHIAANRSARAVRDQDKMSINHSPMIADADQDIICCLEIWERERHNNQTGCLH